MQTNSPQNVDFFVVLYYFNNTYIKEVISMSMKKKSILLLAALPLCLASCGTDSAVALPNNGTVITDTTAVKKQLAQSIETEVDTGALGFSIDNAHFNLGMTMENKMTSTDNTAVKSTMEYHYNVTDVTLKGAMKGLKSTNASDIAGSLTGSAKIKGSVKINAGGATAEDNKEESGAFGIYFNHAYTYFDLSNFADLTASSSIGANASAALSGSVSSKIKTVSNFAKANLPLVSEESYNALLEWFTKTGENEEGEFRDHGNNTYSYSFTMDGDTITENINGNTKSATTEETSYLPSVSNSLTASKDTSLTYAIIFNEEGLVSVGFAGKVGVEMKNSSTVGGYTTSTNANVTIDLSVKLSFTHGKNVVVETVSDPDQYTLSGGLGI